MKFLKGLLFIAIPLLIITGCQKELSFGGTSVGTLKSSSGDCLPSIIVGTYKVDSVLNNTNYIDVTVNATVEGTFVVKSDTLNGYSFYKAGSLGLGDNIIRLYATGKPITAGTNSFTIAYGASSCRINVVVTGPGGTGGTAVFTLGGSPGTCTGGVANGTYTVGTPLTAANTLTVTVNVTTPGTFTIGVLPVNGIGFGTSGTFTTTGPQTLTLNGTGIPVAAGTSNLSVTDGTNTCTLPITVVAAAAPAVFTLNGAPTACTGVTMAGTYTQGIILTAANTATLSVNVSTIGGYTITTAPANGVIFSATGSFTTTGPQTVVLKGVGTPTAAGAANYTATGNASSSCTFSITYAAPAPPATLTFVGAPSLCTGAVVNGTYSTGVPLNATNTVVLNVNVTVAGSYSISTNNMNGIVFTGSGVFTATGPQAVTLTGSGIPQVVFNSVFTPSAGLSTCNFVVNIGAPTGIYTCKIDGVFKSFYDRAKAETDDGFGGIYLAMDGYTGPANGGNVPQLQLFIEKNDGSSVGPGTYNVDGLLLPNGYRIEVDYHLENPDGSVTIWNTSSTIFPPPNPPFTIVVTSVTGGRAKGTFSGTLTNTLQGSTLFKVVTEGVFDLPIQ